MKQTIARTLLLSASLSLGMCATAALADPGPSLHGDRGGLSLAAIYPTGCQQKMAGFSVWSNDFQGMNPDGLYAQALVSNPYPYIMTNPLVYFGFPAATTSASATIHIVMRQTDAKYALYGVLRVTNDEGGYFDIYPDESQHITSEWVEYSYPVGQVVKWGKSRVTLTVTSSLTSGTYVQVDSLWVMP